MNWSTIWELIKINILYSNPQSLANLKKRQEKHPKENFKAYKSMMRQQALMIAMFLVIYLFMFIGVDFSHYPGLFSFDVAMFFIMSTLTAFSSLYTIFYESNDLKLYIHLPVTSEELYIAKIVSSLGMGAVFLMPLLSSLNCLLATIGKSFVYFSSYCALFSVTSEFDGISHLYQCLGG